MKRNIYGNRMFIADLILTSIWAFFVSRYCSMGLMLMILIRIVLCFEMERKSPWTLVSAVGFMTTYIGARCFTKPFERMFYLFFCSIGESELMVDIFSQPLEWEMEAWIGTFSGLWFLWLAVLPIIVGFSQRNLSDIQWKRKWIWIYLIPLTALCVWVMFMEGEVGGIILGLGVSILPIIYWCIYNRHGRSPVQLIIDDRKIRWYLAYTAFMLAVVTIGLKDIFSMKLVGVLLFPALFYIILMSSLRLGTVLTRCCLALSVSGLLYWLTLYNGKTASIIMLSAALILIVYAGITMMRKSKSISAALALMIIVPTAIIPFTLGLNPYIILDADHTRMYATNLSVRQGVYVVERYVELAEEGTPYYWSMKHGLRDRYGIILPMEYDMLNALDGWGRYIVTSQHVRYGCMKADQRYGVFDLKKRQFVVNPDNIEVMDIKKIDDRSFKLINPEGRHFATLYLPGYHNETYFPDAHIEPHFADGMTSVVEFLEQAENVDLDIDDYYCQEMKTENPHAYRLFVTMMDLGSNDGSPESDLNYARAIREIIKRDMHYKGDYTKAISDVEKLSERITDSGSQSSINMWTDIRRLISSIKTSLDYDALMSDNPENDGIVREYVAWHNLIEAMAYYQDYLYSAESYQSEPEEKNASIKDWLDYRRVCLGNERDILSGKLVYSVPSSRSDSLRGKDDFNELFSHFHRYDKPHYYHPMWNEIKTAFDEWISARNTIAEELDPHRALSYREYSREVADSIFSHIQELDKPYFRPILY